MKTLLCSFLCFFALLNQAALAQKSGIRGKVTFLSGNQMPGPDYVNSGKGVKRKIYVYEGLQIPFDKLENGFFPIPQEKPIVIIQSNKKGKFKVRLKPGTYSLLIAEKEGYLWGNVFDSQGFINPVKVDKDKTSNTEIQINYNASF